MTATTSARDVPSRADDAQTLAAFYDGFASAYLEKIAGSERYFDRVRADVANSVAERSARVLDIGCGPGQLTSDLPESVAVVGFDLSQEMLALAKTMRPSGTYLLHDFHEPFPAPARSMDVAIAFGAFEYCADLPTSLRNVADALKPGGRAFFSVCERRATLPGQQDARRLIKTKTAEFMTYYFSVVDVAHALETAALELVAFDLALGWTGATDQKSMTTHDMMYGYYTATKPLG